MRFKKAPFRSYLKRGQGKRQAATNAYRDLQRVLARDYLADDDFLRKVVDHEDELLPWLLIQQEQDQLTYPRTTAWAKMAVELLN